MPAQLPCDCHVQVVPSINGAILLGLFEEMVYLPDRYTLSDRVLVFDATTETVRDAGWTMHPPRGTPGAGVFGTDLVLAGGGDPHAHDDIWHRSLINQPPTLNVWASHASVKVGEWVRFEAAASDADGTVTGISWDLGDGQAAQGAEVVRTYPSPGTYHITATATDSETGTATRTVTLAVEAAAASTTQTTTAQSHTVPPPPPPQSSATSTSTARRAEGNQPPLAAASCVETGLVVSCSAIASLDDDGDPLTFSWSWGDGNASVGSPVTHAYAAPGLYEIRLEASDGRATGEHVVAIRLGADRPPTDNAVSVIGPAAQEHDEEAPAPSPAVLLLVLFALAVLGRRRP